mgnify:FL=1
MSKLLDFFKLQNVPINEIECGLYTSHNLLYDDIPYRLHLRVEHNQTGVLTLNASTVLHLNKTAMEMAYFLIQGQNPLEIANTISLRYKAPKDEIIQDVESFYTTLMSFVNNQDLPPTGFLGVIQNFEESEIIAPYRLDCYFSQNEKSTLLSISEWKVIFEKVYNAGIPHIILLNVDFLTKSDLFELLTHLEDLGLVSGLVTTPSFLENANMLEEILNRGLDHIILDADPTNKSHLLKTIEILNQDLYTCLRMPVHENHDYKSIIEKLFDAGINAIAFSKDSNSFSPTFINLEQIIIKKQIPIIDDMPFSNPAEDYTFNKLHYSKSKLKYLKLAGVLSARFLSDKS